MIHHSMLAAKIFAPPSTKVVAKPSEREDNQSDKQSDRPPNGKKIINDKKISDANKGKDKGQYKGNNRLSPKELEQYCKANKCFQCGIQGHTYCQCPNKKNNNKEAPKASSIEANEVKDPQASQLCYNLCMGKDPRSRCFHNL